MNGNKEGYEMKSVNQNKSYDLKENGNDVIKTW